MIIVSKDGKLIGYFKDYIDFFDYFAEKENMKLLSKQAEYQQMDWDFTIHPPKQVSVLFTHSNGQDSAIREACEEGLPLIEICAGSYKHPTYIINTFSGIMPKCIETACVQLKRELHYLT